MLHSIITEGKLTIVFEKEESAVYDSCVLYFYKTLRNYAELYPHMPIVLKDMSKYEFNKSLSRTYDRLVWRKTKITQTEDFLDWVYMDGSMGFGVIHEKIEDEKKQQIADEIINSVVKYSRCMIGLCNVYSVHGDFYGLIHSYKIDKKFDEWTLCQTAKNGYLNCLKFLFEHSNEFVENTFELSKFHCTYYAAVGGYLDCLKFVCEEIHPEP